MDAFPYGHALGLARRAFKGLTLPFDVARVQTIGLLHSCKSCVLASIYAATLGMGDAKDRLRFHGGDAQGVAVPRRLDQARNVSIGLGVEACVPVIKSLVITTSIDLHVELSA